MYNQVRRSDPVRFGSVSPNAIGSTGVAQIARVVGMAARRSATPVYFRHAPNPYSYFNILRRIDDLLEHCRLRTPEQKAIGCSYPTYGNQLLQIGQGDVAVRQIKIRADQYQGTRCGSSGGRRLLCNAR